MAQAAVGAQSGGTAEHRPQQHIGMHMALHDGIGISLADQSHAGLGRCRLVGGIHQPYAVQIPAQGLGFMANACFTAHQNGGDQPFFLGQPGTGQRHLIHRVDHHGSNGRILPGLRQQVGRTFLGIGIEHH